jgi:hypothetical protein
MLSPFGLGSVVVGLFERNMHALVSAWISAAHLPSGADRNKPAT